MVKSLDSFGFTINFTKSSLIPAQRIVFFGFIIDSVEFKVYLTEEKLQKILTKAKALLKKGVVIVRALASFIGLIINAFYAVFEAPLHYRGLERNKLAGLGVENNFDNEVILSKTSIEELNWWIDNVRLKNGKVIRHKAAEIQCRTDASLEGWGSIDLDTNLHTNGRWNAEESCNPIHILEMLAIFYALQSLYSNKRDVHIEIQSDNVISIKYITDLGGMTSKSMDRLAYDIWDWCLERRIVLSAVFIAGYLNTADFYSRSFTDHSEFMLKGKFLTDYASNFLSQILIYLPPG